MIVYFKSKLGVTSTVKLEKNNTTEQFVSKIQDNGGMEKVRVNMITSSCNCGTDLTSFLLQDIDKEITLVNVIEHDDSLSHINALYEEVRFIDIQNKEEKVIDILLQHKSDFLENNGPSVTNSKTRRGLMGQIALLKGELEEKYRQISALLNILKTQQKIHYVLYKITYIRKNLKKYQNTLQNVQTAHHRCAMILTHLEKLSSDK